MNEIGHSRASGFRLRDLRVEPGTGRIYGPAGEVRLEPRLMAVLEALAHQAGQLVSRSELLESIWPGGEVYDEALTQTVYQLRQQLQIAGGGDEYRHLITTIPKRGFILNSEVLPQYAPLGSATGSAARFDPRWLAALVLVLAVAVGLAWHFSSRTSSPPDSASAVCPNCSDFLTRRS